ncbi:MAG: DUF1329 domain-containing protein [Nevskiales bacterium]|nr:DUF1329 domain-containing protein [Nevskiales bacterium]
MRIKKYDFNYSRRVFLEKGLMGAAAAGVLAPLWPEIGRAADITKAYPDELLSIEAYTKGKVKPGDVITADNVDIVKDLLDPIAYQQVKTMGRRINIVETTRDVTKLFPYEYLEATLRNQGQGTIGADGNVWTKGGEPWIGGNPFPEPEDGLQAMANVTLSWGRHNFSMYAIKDWEISPGGDISYAYDFVWAELNTTARADGTIWNGKKDLLRYQSVWFTAPNDTKGSSFLNTWEYDQRKFPALLGYLPAFRRTREFPTNQRFEPLVPGITFFLSDAWSSGDPLLTWGNYKIVERKPMLGAVSNNWTGGRNENWERELHGGPKGQTFHETYMELCPECLVVEAEPTSYPRAPVGKKRVWIDVRNGMFVAYVTYDRRGEIWKSFEPGFSQYVDGDAVFLDNGHPAWSWNYVLCHDFQANRMTRFIQARECTGGYKSGYDDSDDVYNKYLTVQAINRLGAT